MSWFINDIHLLQGGGNGEVGASLFVLEEGPVDVLGFLGFFNRVTFPYLVAEDGSPHTDTPCSVRVRPFMRQNCMVLSDTVIMSTISKNNVSSKDSR